MKQMDVTTKKIGDFYFYITPFPAFTAARISGELASVIAPVLGSLSPLMKGADVNNAVNIADMDVDEAFPAVADALSQLDGEKFEHLMKQLLIDYKNIAYDNENNETERLTYDAANEIFCGEMQDMLILCWEVIKLNFGGFFRKIAGQSGDLQDITDQAVKKLKGKNSGTKNGEAST